MIRKVGAKKYMAKSPRGKLKFTKSKKAAERHAGHKTGGHRPKR